MAQSVTEAAEVFRRAMRDSMRRHSLWHLVQGIMLTIAGALAIIYQVISSYAVVTCRPHQALAVLTPAEAFRYGLVRCFRRRQEALLISNLFWLTEAQMAWLEPFFPKSHGRPRVDDRRVPSGIIFINRNGLRWCDAPREYGPPT